jgi:hypothetical protein
MDVAQKHKLIEKKRREKINKKFDELKIVIGLENDKVTKYEILNSSIEYIEALKKENDEYKNKLQKNNNKDIIKITKKMKNTTL